MTYSKRLESFALAPTLRFLSLRLARMYPLVLFVLVLLAIGRLARYGPEVTANLILGKGFWLQVLMLNGWGLESDWAWNVPSWSVSSEWLCYLLFPLVAPLIGRIRNGALAMVLAWLTMGLTALTMT
jgi:peptidoglycan/LPS O-acetylase OafA/YrhL